VLRDVAWKGKLAVNAYKKTLYGIASRLRDVNKTDARKRLCS
jgi:hypothetical protein